VGSEGGGEAELDGLPELPLLRHPPEDEAAQTPAPPETLEVGAVKRFFEELERTFKLLKELPPEVQPLIEEGLAKKQAEVADWLAEAASKWKDLAPEVKVEELAMQVKWRRSKYDECEFVYVDEAPELRELLEKCENGKLEAGGFAYYLRGKVVKRYPRKNGKVAQQAAPQTSQQAASQQAPQGGESK
jgi:hypothetical protein